MTLFAATERNIDWVEACDNDKEMILVLEFWGLREGDEFSENYHLKRFFRDTTGNLLMRLYANTSTKSGNKLLITSFLTEYFSQKFWGCLSVKLYKKRYRLHLRIVDDVDDDYFNRLKYPQNLPI